MPLPSPRPSPDEVALDHAEILRYSRQIVLPEVGLAGQKKLKAASVLLVGTGGLGSPVALYLAAAGVGRIGLVDHDVVDITNLHRQIVHSGASVGRSKVDAARRRMLDLNPAIDVVAHDEPLTAANAMRILAGYDVVVDGSDNFPTRYLVNDACVLLGKPNVYGSVYRFEGQVAVFHAPAGPCYRCLFPEPPPPGMTPSCAEGGVLGILPGTIGTLQATETLKLILGIGSSLVGRLVLYDALAMRFDTVALGKNLRCAICGEHPTVTGLIDYEHFCGVPGHDRELQPPTDWDITPRELAARLNAGDDLTIIDVREPHERQISCIDGAVSVPLGELPARLHTLDPARGYVLQCKGGARSRKALELLRAAGFHNLHNLQGGISAWARDVDPRMPVY